MMLTLDRYTELNKSFKKIAICRFGIDAGFFAEYRSLIDMMLYCLEHHIQLKIYSTGANFGYEKGWTDYFKPFCEEVDDSFHHYCNFHTYISWMKLWNGDDKLSFSMVKWKIKLDLLRIVGLYYKRKTGNFDYYTQDIYRKIKSYNRNYKIPELNFEGNYAEAYSLINSLTWQFQKDIKNSIDRMIQELHLPSYYLACHIRGGDKIIEFPLYTVESYIRRIKNISSCKDVFVLTDDFRLLSQLKEKAPDYRWYSFCKPTEHGYYNRAFSKIEPLQKKEQMIRFFASIECMKSSSLFLGSVTSGPSLFIANLKYPNVHFVDIDTSSYLSTLDMNRRDCKKLIQKYMNNQ